MVRLRPVQHGIAPGETAGAEEAVKNATDPLVRGLRCLTDKAETAQAILQTPAPWKPSTPETVKTDRWSSAAYHMAHKLRAEPQVPVGIMMVYQGATPGPFWTAPEGLEFAPETENIPGHGDRKTGVGVVT